MSTWLPARYTQPLSEDFPSDADWLIPLVETVWIQNGRTLVLDAWQKWLLRLILETYPPGHRFAGRLRFRQFFVSVGRQNGKSVIGAVLALYGLLRQPGELVIGLASNADQAKIIYDRTLKVLRTHPDLAKRFRKLNDGTAGIMSNEDSRYLVKPAKSSSVQGLDVSVGLFDELHISKQALWSDLVSGTAARPGGFVFGISTAGDETSELLLNLYDLAESGEAGERFGFAIWEAPEARLPEDDEELGRYLMAANPSLSEGRLDLSTAIADVRTLPPQDAIRYRLNRFVAAKTGFMSAALWQGAQIDTKAMPKFTRPVFSFIMSPARDWTTVCAAQVIDGTTYVRIVAQAHAWDQAKQMEYLERIWKNNPSRYVIHKWTLGGLAENANKRRYPVAVAAFGDEIQSSGHLYGLVAHGKIKHDGNEVVARQMAAAQRKNTGSNFKIVAPEDGEVDAVYAVAYAALYAEIDSVKGQEFYLV